MHRQEGDGDAPTVGPAAAAGVAQEVAATATITTRQEGGRWAWLSSSRSLGLGDACVPGWPPICAIGLGLAQCRLGRRKTSTERPQRNVYTIKCIAVMRFVAEHCLPLRVGSFDIRW